MIYQLNYTLRLSEQAVFSQLGGDPNIVQSEGYVPGSAVWGALAGRLIQKLNLGKTAHENELFRRWFLRSGLRCLNAYPTDEEEKIRLLPVPLSIRKEKGNEDSIHDLAAYLTKETSLPDETLKTIEGFGKISGEKLYTANSQTRYNYHTTRVSRVKGRAAKNEGAVFVYEALEAGQLFKGLILGEQADLAELLKILGWAEAKPLELRLGRSRATQYGGATCLKLLSESPEPFSREITINNDDFSENFLVLTLTSSLLLPNESGYPLQLIENADNEALIFPVEPIAKALGLDAAGLSLKYSFARREIIGGYSAVWGLPRPQWPAFKAGSVFVFELAHPQLLGEDKLTEVEAISLGLRTGEGYGRFVLNWHGATKTLTKGKWDEQAKGKPDGEVPEAFKKLVYKVVSRKYDQEARNKGREDSGGFISSDTFKHITPALLGRLQSALHSNSEPEGLKKWLDDLRKPATQQLQRVRISGGASLYERIRDVLATNSVNNIVKPGSTGLDGNTTEVINATGQLLETDPKLLIRAKQIYLLALVEELSRKKRTGREEI